MIKEIKLGGTAVEYELTKKSVKNINLRVLPDGKIKVSAPRRVSEKTVESFIKSKEAFILKALESRAVRRAIRPESFSEGEEFFALGEKCSLHFESGKGTEFLSGGILTLYVKENTAEAHRKAYEKWEKALAEKACAPYIEKAMRDFASYGIKVPSVSFRRMVSRWGSCQTRDAKITLNVYLASVPAECIEYVIYHEFTHLLEANHSEAFYRKLAVFIPDWKQKRNILKKYSAVGR